MDHVSTEFHCIVTWNVFSCSKRLLTETEHIVASLMSHRFEWTDDNLRPDSETHGIAGS